MKNGQIYNIDFNGSKGSEINKIHLGIIFTILKSNNMSFCIPLTSPKEKHFKDC
ncbi:MAG: type II toxin-antitoxin system PemK/MazF family toxin [Bacilli bacterium]|nr:type II toxin-antitoxin system PemK/MazF family toxin [Bacilli bacterium]